MKRQLFLAWFMSSGSWTLRVQADDLTTPPSSAAPASSTAPASSAAPARPAELPKDTSVEPGPTEAEVDAGVGVGLGVETAQPEAGRIIEVTPVEQDKPALAAETKPAPIEESKVHPVQVQPLNCSKGFLSLRTPPSACKGKRQLEYALLPAVFAQKETGFGFVIYNELSFFTDDKPDTHASRAGVALTITTQRQFIARIPTVLSFDNNNWVVDGYADFRIYPNRYYGEGNTADWKYQAYKETVLSFNYEVRRRVWGPFYAGLLWNLRTAFEMNSRGFFDKKGNPLEGPLPSDADDADVELGPYINHGFGLQAAYDTRDDFSYPTRGGYHRTSLQGFAKFLGGDYDYLLWTVDARQYIPTWTNQILALQVLSEVRKGVMPFTVMSEIGGPFSMRGYYRGRYRAGDMLLIQAEYRFPIYRRLSGVGFGNVGEVYGVDSAFRFDRLRWTLGAGLRFRFGEHTYVRFDMGGNHETYAGIFNGGQAF